MTQSPREIIESLMHLGDMPEQCPYLPDRIARLRFGDGFLGAGLYRLLLDAGYRRSGHLLYRPVCIGCNECKVIRVPIASFRPSKEQRRIWNRGNRVFRAGLHAPSYSPEKAALYQRYLRYQHPEGPEEAENSPEGAHERYQRFLVDSCLGNKTIEVQFHAGDHLAGVGIVDHVADALSSVYFYFDPAYARFSPGTYSILWEIDLARRWGLTYYYLGHYIRECRAMNYKARFRPCEIKEPDASTWQFLDGSHPH